MFFLLYAVNQGEYNYNKHIMKIQRERNEKRREKESEGIEIGSPQKSKGVIRCMRTDGKQSA